MLAETDLDTVLATLDAERPEVCVIDSVQTLHAAELTGAAGSVGQVREVADRITRLAKARGIAVLLVGHVTKEGALAGPRVLEHLVDCVLQFEGERERTYRTLRALKNRFGSTNDVGVFEMRQGGLVEVADASARFVGEATRAPGSVVLAAMEGSRPLLVEVQALVSPSELVPPRRVANGIDRNRLALVLAVLGRHAGVGVGSADVFVNVAGGVRVDEPGADLAVALAVASAARGVALGGGERPVACFGEVGLTGELRSVGPRRPPAGRGAKFGLRPVDRARRERRPASRRRRCARRCERRCARTLPRALRANALGPPGTSPGLAPTSTPLGAAASLARSNSLGNRSHLTRYSRDSRVDSFNQLLELGGDDAAIRGGAHRARSAAGAPARQGAGDGRAGHRGPRGHRQHRPRAHRRPDRHRRPRRARVPVLRRHQARHRLLAGDALPARQDGRRDRAQRHRDEDRLVQRPADAGPDDPVARRPARATAPPSASPSRPTRW